VAVPVRLQRRRAHVVHHRPLPSPLAVETFASVTGYPKRSTRQFPRGAFQRSRPRRPSGP
jgi:hypothetical protein